jgi:hypothetical protein
MDQNDANGRLIAAAPEALRFLLAEVERLQGVALAAANVAADFAIERDEAGARGAERERAAVVAWLRAEGWHDAADEIASGAHVLAAVPDGAGGGS